MLLSCFRAALWLPALTAWLASPVLPASAAPPAQNAAALGQKAALAAQMTEREAAVSILHPSPASSSHTSPTIFGQPYANTTGLPVFAHFQTSCGATGGVPWVGTLSVKGGVVAVTEAKAAGYDGFALDMGDDTPGYRANVTALFAAADQVNAAAGWTPGRDGAVNAKGVGKFSLYLVLDCSGFPQTAAKISSTFLAYERDDAYWQVKKNGVSRPVLSTYTGADNEAWASAKSRWQEALTAIRAAGVNVYFLPGFNTTPNGLNSAGLPQPSEQAWVKALLPGLANGAWQFPNTSPTLNSDASAPGMEKKAAAVKAAGLDWQAAVCLTSQTNGPSANHYYLEAYGGEGLAASWASALKQKPTLGVQLVTYNDAGEGTNRTSIYNEQMNPALPAWDGFPHGDIVGFYPPKDGLRADEDFYIQQLKTGQKPRITSDRLCAYYRMQTAAASVAAPKLPITYSHGPDGYGPGMSHGPDYIFVSCYLASAGVIRLTQSSGTMVKHLAPAGQSWVRLPFVAGSVRIDLMRNGQSVISMTGTPVLATAPGGVGNGNYYTMFCKN